MPDDDLKTTKRRPVLAPLRSLLGLGLMTVSALGLALSVAGLLALARTNAGMLSQLEDTLALSLSALETTGQTLTLAEDLLGQSASAFTSMQAATLDTDQTITDADAVIDSMAAVFGDELPGVIASSQESLDSAQESAEVIEGTLTSLNAVSSLTGTRYEPDVTLAESLGSLNDNLGHMPDSFERIASDLDSAGENLGAMDTDLEALAADFGDIADTLTESQAVMADYHALVDDLSENVGDLESSVPRLVRTIRRGGAFLLVWLALTQIGLLFQGWEMFRG